MKLVRVLIVLGVVAGVLLTPTAAQSNFGIDPGKVYIDNLYPGAQAEFPITIYNQNDYETTFVVRARGPDYTAEDEGYDALPYLEWVTVTPDQLTIAPREQSEVLVVIIMPEDADYSGKKSEVWISFMEKETEGMIKIEIASRIFISTRAEATSGTSVRGNGAMGITAEAGGAEPASPEAEAGSPEAESVSPEAEPVSPEAEPSSPWATIGLVLGVFLVGGTVFFLVKSKRRV